MKDFISLRKSEDGSIYGAMKVPKRNKKKNGTTQTHADGQSAYMV